MRYHDNILHLIGNTPLVRLNKLTTHVQATVLAKVEYLNPGGSVKDRIAVRIVDDAENAGLLRPGGTIIEPTSGNTGVGLALVAQQRGYQCIFVCPDKVSTDKQNVLRAYGAQVVVCPTAVAPQDPRSYYAVSDRLVREIPGAYKPDQYSNPANPRSHYESTGPELWEQTDARLTHFVAGIGTGGTITGTGRYLKEVSDGRVQIIGADPEGSVYSGGTGRPYLVEGVGEDFWPEAFDPQICDEIIEISDATSFRTTRRLAREEGLLVGGSCGMAVAAALQIATRAAPSDLIVVLLPDGGRGYLSKVFDDDWMARYGFAPSGEPGATVAEILAAKDRGIPTLIHVHPTETIRDAIDHMREYGVSQLPVLRAEPPVVTGEIAGAIDERDLLDALFNGRANLHDTVEAHMRNPFPMIGAGQSVDEAVTTLEKADAAMVLTNGKPTGVLTRQDLLNFLGTTPH